MLAPPLNLVAETLLSLINFFSQAGFCTDFVNFLRVHEGVRALKENKIPSTASTTAPQDAVAKSARFVWSPSAVQTISSFTTIFKLANSLAGTKK